MSKDIVDRLRGLYVQNGTNYVQEAADEIECLRLSLDNCRFALSDWLERTSWIDSDIRDGSLSAGYLGYHKADIMKAEIHRLREEIDNLRHKNSMMSGHDFDDFGSLINWDRSE